MIPAADKPLDDEREGHPARELSLHLLRMLETRMDAASIALQGETQIVMARLQLRMLGAAAIFIAIWGGIVLLAIALPPNLRVPVLSLVVLGFVAAGVGCHFAAKRRQSTREVGSLAWFLESLKMDLEVLSRALAFRAHVPTPAPAPPQAPSPFDPPRSPPNDLAA